MVEYPDRLYPKKEYIIIRNPDLEHILCRYTEPDVVLKGDDNKLNGEAIPLERIPGLSTNKVPESIIEDCYLKIKPEHKNKYLLEWKEGEDPVPVDNEHFDYVNTRGYFLFKIKDIHNFTFKCPYPSKGDKQDYVFHVIVKHAPLVSNFFHFELEILDLDNNPIIGAKSTWRKVIMQSIQSEFFKIAKFSIDDI